MSASSVYTLFSGAAFGYATFVAIQTLSRKPPPVAMSNFNRILLKFGYATLVAPSAVVPVIMWFETTKLQVYLHEWRLFQDNYNRVIGKSEDTAMMAIVKKRVNRIYRSILVFLSITGVAISYSSSTVSDVFLLVCAIKSISTMVFIAGFWFVGAIVIEATIDSYKKKLQTDLDGHVDFRFGARSIEDYRLLWLQMSRLVHGAGDYMSATVTFCIFHTTVAVILSVYTLAVWGATLVTQLRYEALASATVMLIYNATSLYVYCDCGYSQTKKVGYLRRQRDTTNFENEVIDELDEFELHSDNVVLECRESISTERECDRFLRNQQRIAWLDFILAFNILNSSCATEFFVYHTEHYRTRIQYYDDINEI